VKVRKLLDVSSCMTVFSFETIGFTDESLIDPLGSQIHDHKF